MTTTVTYIALNTVAYTNTANVAGIATPNYIANADIQAENPEQDYPLI